MSTRSATVFSSIFLLLLFWGGGKMCHFYRHQNSLQNLQFVSLNVKEKSLQKLFKTLQVIFNVNVSCKSSQWNNCNCNCLNLYTSTAFLITGCYYARWLFVHKLFFVYFHLTPGKNPTSVLQRFMDNAL